MPNEYLDIPDNDYLPDSLLSEVSHIEKDITIDIAPKVKVKAIKPKPGFCLKTKLKNEDKVFINVCTCPEIPPPKDIDEGEVKKILESEDPSSYRVPLSIGDAHPEKDKSGGDCTCYDVVINTEFFNKMQKSEVFKRFITSLCYESVQDKYNLDFKEDFCVMLRNKQYHGNMPAHYIRDKPLIAELNSQYTNGSANFEGVHKKTPDSNKVKSPKYILRKQPAKGVPVRLILQVWMPNVALGDTASVSVGEDRVVVYEKTQKYSVDIYLPSLIKRAHCSAEFDVCDKILTVFMPVVEAV